MVSLTTVLVASISYFIHPHKLGEISATINPDAVIPVTLMTTEEIFGGQLEQVLADFDERDDVFIPDFGAVLVEKVLGNETESVKSVDRSSVSQQVYSMISDPAITNDLVELPSGPYILYGPNLYQVWRMYPDSQGAFTTGVFVENVSHPDAHQALPFKSSPLSEGSVAVPSRLYHSITDAKPLAGLRIAISDAFDLKGTWSTMSSRDYTSTLSPAIFTVPFIRNLVDLGAILVGKTKVQPLGTGTQWVDVQQPWNPRGDGYRATAGSGAGAAVAMASYEWLDNALDEDGIAGLQTSAACMGSYALRPTYNSTVIDGLRVNSETFGTISGAASALKDLNKTQIAPRDLGCNFSNTSVNGLVVVQDFLNPLDGTQKDKFQDFAQAIAESLGLRSEEISLANSWDQSTPEEAQGASLQDYMSSAVNVTFSYDYYHAYETFLEDFPAQHGVQPFLEETSFQLLEYGRTVTEEDLQGASQQIQTFKKWFQKNVFKDAQTLVLFPPKSASAKPRFETDVSPPELGRVSPHNLAALLGAPQLNIPYGQVEVDSSSNGAQEKIWLPVSAAIIGPLCSDGLVLSTMQEALEKAGLPTEVRTGQLAFAVEQESRSKREDVFRAELR